MKIFGRDPALWLGLIAAAVMNLGLFLHWTAEQQGVVNTVASAAMAVVIAIVVKAKGDGMVAVLLGGIKAILAAGLAFGLHLSPEWQMSLMTLATAIAVFAMRTQLTAPVAKAEVRDA